MFILKIQGNSEVKNMMINLVRVKKMTEVLQGIGCMCVHIASKIYEYDTARVEEYAKMTNNSYTSSTLAQFERIILEQLDGNIIIPSLFTYLIHKRKETDKDRYKLREMYLKTDIYSKPFKNMV